MTVRSYLLLLASPLMFSSCMTDEDVDWKDYDIITTASQMNAYYDGLNLDLSGNSETAAITKYFDGTADITYEYENTEDPKYDPLYFSITVDVGLTEKDARETYTISKLALIEVGELVDFENEEIPVDLGHDETYYSLRSYEGELNGHLFVTRKGKNVYSMIISGLYSDDHSLLYDLIVPAISDLENFKLKD